MKSCLWALTVSLPMLFSACSNQAEGERCDLDNRNLDCESGLVCKSLRSLGDGDEGAICCPETGANVPACRPGSLQLDDDDEPADDEPTEPNGDDAGASAPAGDADAGNSSGPADAAVPADARPPVDTLTDASAADSSASDAAN